MDKQTEAEGTPLSDLTLWLHHKFLMWRCAERCSHKKTEDRRQSSTSNNNNKWRPAVGIAYLKDTNYKR